MKDYEEFSLTGTTRKRKGKYAAVITLRTADGKETVLESEYAFTEAEARAEVKRGISEVLKSFGDDAEVVEYKEVRDGKLVQ